MQRYGVFLEPLRDTPTLEDAKMAVRNVKDSGLDTIFVHSMYRYNSEISPVFPQFKNYDPLSTLVKLSKKEEIRVIAVLEVNTLGGAGEDQIFFQLDRIKENWREWLIVDNEGQRKDSVHGVVWVCPRNQEHLSWKLEMVKEIVENYDVDGLWLRDLQYPVDWPFFKSYCFCDDCVWDFSSQGLDAYERDEEWLESFLRENGRMSFVYGNSYGAWSRFCCEQINNEAEKIVRTAKRIKPDCEVSALVTPGGMFQGIFTRCQNHRALARILDALYTWGENVMPKALGSDIDLLRRDLGGIRAELGAYLYATGSLPEYARMTEKAGLFPPYPIGMEYLEKCINILQKKRIERITFFSYGTLFRARYTREPDSKFSTDYWNTALPSNSAKRIAELLRA